MTKSDLKRVIELGEKATPGPWEVDENDPMYAACIFAPQSVTCYDEDMEDAPVNAIAKPMCDCIAHVRRDMSLIAHYRTAAPEMARALLAIHDALDLNDNMDEPFDQIGGHSAVLDNSSCVKEIKRILKGGTP